MEQLDVNQTLVLGENEVESIVLDLFEDLTGDGTEQGADIAHLCDVSTEPLSACSTGSAVELDFLCRQHNSVGYGASYSSYTADRQFGLCHTSTAQLQGTAYTQVPTQAMQLQADQCTAGAVLGGYYQALPWLAAMAAQGGQQLCSMVMDAPAQQQVRVPLRSQEPQISVRAISKRRAVSASDSMSSDNTDDKDYDPVAGVCWQSCLRMC
jgi:hypothetical protein